MLTNTDYDEIVNNVAHEMLINITYIRLLQKIYWRKASSYGSLKVRLYFMYKNIHYKLEIKLSLDNTQPLAIALYSQPLHLRWYKKIWLKNLI